VTNRLLKEAVDAALRAPDHKPKVKDALERYSLPVLGSVTALHAMHTTHKARLFERLPLEGLIQAMGAASEHSTRCDIPRP
jgi:hypothetical protein